MTGSILPNLRKPWRIASALLIVIVCVTGGWLWKEKQRMDELVSPGLILINYTDKDVYASVHYDRFPNPGEGASDGMGPHAGGGSLVCCVPIPAHWRPGIMMNVWFSHKDWQKENGETKTIELPEYPDGRPGYLYLVFHDEIEFELYSSFYAPGHPRWPGKQVVPVDETLKK